jgi:hypothetical protein
MERRCIGLAIVALAQIAGASGAHADDKACTPARDGTMVCPAPGARCIADRTGEVICSTPGGGIEVDRYGDVICGPGYCTKDIRGDVFCSSATQGAASNDRYGNAACAVSCVPAKAHACVKPKPAGR